MACTHKHSGAWSSLMLLVALLLTPLAHGQDNLLLNPGFEEGINGWKTWSSAANALLDPTITTNAGQAHAGSKYAQLDWSTTETFMTLAQEFDTAARGMQPGSIYTAKVWCKTTAIGGGDRVRVNFTNVVAGGDAYAFNAGVTGTQSVWTEQTLNFVLSTSQSTQVYQLQVSPSLSTVGSVYVDDASVTAAPAGELGNLLANAGFENGTTGWQVWSSAANALGPPTIVTDGAQAHGGTKFAQLTWVPTESFMVLTQDIDTGALGMTPGDTYVLRMWHKTGVLQAGSYVRMNFTNVVGGGTFYVNNPGISNTQSAWVEQVYAVTLPTNQTVNTYQLQINPYLAPNETVYVDDCTLTVPGSATGNLMDNAGFEDGSTGWLVWSALANANLPANVTTDAVGAHGGSKYAQLTWTQSETYLMLYRQVDALVKGLIPGNDYTISAWYKTDPAYPVDQTVQLIFTNTQASGGFWYNNEGVGGPVSAWTKQEATFTMPTDQTITLYGFQVRPNAAQGIAAGTLYVDDTALTLPPLPPSLSKTWSTYE